MTLDPTAIADAHAPRPRPRPPSQLSTATPDPNSDGLASAQPSNRSTCGPRRRPSRISGALPYRPDRRARPTPPVPAQSADWLALKAAGRLALIDGQPTVLLPNADPLTMPRIGLPVPGARTLVTGYARWIIEPLGKGKDVKGNDYEDDNFWNFCEVGATTVALYYWQQLNGHPNVTGTAGYFIDPYAAEGVAWPSPGPTLPMSGEERPGHVLDRRGPDRRLHRLRPRLPALPGHEDAAARLEVDRHGRLRDQRPADLPDLRRAAHQRPGGSQLGGIRPRHGRTG